MYNRRSFIKRGFMFSAGLAMLPHLSWSQNGLTKITILHTNDLHCRFEPFPDNDARFAGKGGMNRISAYAKALRKHEPQLIMLDSGDFSQGTPYYNFFGTDLVIKMMSEMGYDAATIGNHEFDLGLEDLANAVSKSKFPLVSSNYNFSGTPMQGKSLQNLVMERNGIRIGIYGLGIELNGLVDPKQFGATTYQNPLTTAIEQETYLREQEQCDFIICLSHLGYQYQHDKISDQVIAQNTSFTDLIIGGHTHTFLESPVELINKANQTVVVNQVGWASLMLGQLTFYFENQKRKVFDQTPNKPVG